MKYAVLKRAICHGMKDFNKNQIVEVDADIPKAILQAVVDRDDAKGFAKKADAEKFMEEQNVQVEKKFSPEVAKVLNKLSDDDVVALLGKKGKDLENTKISKMDNKVKQAEDKAKKSDAKLKKAQSEIDALKEQLAQLQAKK